MCSVTDMHAESIEEKLMYSSDNKFKELLFDKTIEYLEDLDLSSLISYVEEKLESFSKLQIILLGLTSVDQCKIETDPQVIVKTEVEEKTNDDHNGNGSPDEYDDYEYNDYDNYKHYEQLEEDIREKKAEDRDDIDEDFVPQRHFRKELKKLGIAPVKIKLEKKESKVSSEEEKVPKRWPKGPRQGVKGKKFKDGTIDVNGMFVCEDCGQDIQGYHEYKRHKHSIHRRKILAKREKEYCCQICGTTMTTTYVKFKYHRILCEAKTVEEKTLMCSECGKAFATQYHLTNHRSKVHSNRPKKKYDAKKYCPYEGCEYGIEGKINLENHINRIHLNKPISKEHVCQLCGNSYNKVHHLTQHIKSFHNNEKPYKCEICQKSFIRTSSLKEHMDSHTGVQRYKCPYCEKPFTHSGSMFHHKKNCKYNPEK